TGLLLLLSFCLTFSRRSLAGGFHGRFDRFGDLGLFVGLVAAVIETDNRGRFVEGQVHGVVPFELGVFAAFDDKRQRCERLALRFVGVADCLDGLTREFLNLGDLAELEMLYIHFRLLIYFNWFLRSIAAMASSSSANTVFRVASSASVRNGWGVMLRFGQP